MQLKRAFAFVLTCMLGCGTDVIEHEVVEDTDRDGLDDSAEEELGTDPEDPDSDDDGLLDGAEVENDLDPLDPNSN